METIVGAPCGSCMAIPWPLGARLRQNAVAPLAGQARRDARRRRPARARMLKRRLSTLDRVLKRLAGPGRVVFRRSACARAFLLSQLGEAERYPRSACRRRAARRPAAGAATPDFAPALCWTPIFSGRGSRRERGSASRSARYRLSAWRDHPDLHAAEKISGCCRLPFIGVDRPSASSSPLTIHARYAGQLDAPCLGQRRPAVARLVRRAQILGRAMSPIASRAARPLLAGAHLRVEADSCVSKSPPPRAPVQRSRWRPLATLAAALGLERSRIVVVDWARVGWAVPALRAPERSSCRWRASAKLKGLARNSSHGEEYWRPFNVAGADHWRLMGLDRNEPCDRHKIRDKVVPLSVNPGVVSCFKGERMTMLALVAGVSIGVGRSAAWGFACRSGAVPRRRGFRPGANSGSVGRDKPQCRHGRRLRFGGRSSLRSPPISRPSSSPTAAAMASPSTTSCDATNQIDERANNLIAQNSSEELKEKFCEKVETRRRRRAGGIGRVGVMRRARGDGGAVKMPPPNSELFVEMFR